MLFQQTACKKVIEYLTSLRLLARSLCRVVVGSSGINNLIVQIYESFKTLLKYSSQILRERKQPATVLSSRLAICNRIQIVSSVVGNKKTIFMIKRQQVYTKAPTTLHRRSMKTKLYFSDQAFRPNLSGEIVYRKRSFAKTLLKTELCILVWEENI